MSKGFNSGFIYSRNNLISKSFFINNLSRLAQYIPPVENKKLKSLSLDEPYDNENEISDIAIATKKKNIVPPKLLRNIYANLERLINQYPITTWINGLMKGYSYPFINNLVEYISNDHPVVFMLFESIDSSIRKFINESKCTVVIIPHPIKKYFQFKDSNCFVEAQQLAL
ncbi:hypothetical protein LY90DRAFT_513120 [Neocallimastix californiae]|uniref:Uncharacterized protein n=1 Tax=Neocallimastix californiae TaxID=1754190 RepID=A0A1Y2B1E8_9FUNG|nr:hypothetical protein LY90DRAFT_513120 [Neocallimastix californiae]|eukprot:ORY28566.1 hypothetical protein LY90DRAFT_513120 [Neocallimastix californiae]